MVVVPGPLTNDNAKVSVTLEEHQHFSELRKEHLARAQNRMKLQADHKRSHKQF
jgi:hypothetical protein